MLFRSVLISFLTNYCGLVHSETATRSSGEATWADRNLNFSPLNSHSSDHPRILVLFASRNVHGVKCGIGHETNMGLNPGLASFNCVI